MDSVRVHVVEVDGKRLTVGMFNQLEHVACRTEGALKGDVLGWVNRKPSCCSYDRHYIWTLPGDLSDSLYIDCISFEREIQEQIHQSATTCAWSAIKETEDYATACARATPEGKFLSPDAYVLRREMDSKTRQFVAQYLNTDPTLEPEVLTAITEEVTPLQQQQRMFEALPQLFVGR